MNSWWAWQWKPWCWGVGRLEFQLGGYWIGYAIRLGPLERLHIWAPDD